MEREHLLLMFVTILVVDCCGMESYSSNSIRHKSANVDVWVIWQTDPTMFSVVEVSPSSPLPHFADSLCETRLCVASIVILEDSFQFQTRFVKVFIAPAHIFNSAYLPAQPTNAFSFLMWKHLGGNKQAFQQFKICYKRHCYNKEIPEQTQMFSLFLRSLYTQKLL